MSTETKGASTGAKKGPVYILGPMRRIQWYNFPAFDAARDKLIAHGYDVISPADLDRAVGFDPMRDCKPDHDWDSIPEGFSLTECVKRDLDAVQRSAYYAALPNWENSTGATAEHKTAVWLKLPRIDIETGLEMPEVAAVGAVRAFTTGAIRDLDTEKIDPEGFLSPLVMVRYCEYMHRHRKTAAGMRASDNWQKGIPQASLMQSGWRHFMDWWLEHRGLASREGVEDAICGLLFNAQAYLLAVLKARKYGEKTK